MLELANLCMKSKVHKFTHSKGKMVPQNRTAAKASYRPKKCCRFLLR